MIKKILILLMITLICSSCGRKSALEPPANYIDKSSNNLTDE